MKFPYEWKPAKPGAKPSNQADGEAESLRSSCAFCCLSTVNKSSTKTRWSESWPGTNSCWYCNISIILSVDASWKSIKPRGYYSKEKMIHNLRTYSINGI